MSKYSVVGAGFCGLAVAYFLLKAGHQVVLYDKRGIGKNTSSAAAGLVHPFPGFAMRVSRDEKEALNETRALIKEAQRFSEAPLITQEGIVRAAMNERQDARMRELLDERDDVVSCECDWVKEGLMTCKITSGFAVDCRAYVMALFELCKSMGMEFEQKEVTQLEQNMVLATGYETDRLIEMEGFEKIKGQMVQGEMDQYVEGTLGKGYVAKASDGIHIGSTYERGFLSVEPDDEGVQTILNQADSYLKGMEGFRLKGVSSGVRLSRKGGYEARCEKIDEGHFVLAGMGSRGLLYHALYGKKLAKQLFEA